MFKILILIFCVINSLSAVDTELNIVRKNNTIPMISVVVTEDSIKTELSSKIKKILEDDLIISGHFNVIKNNINHKSIDTEFDFLTQSEISSNFILFLEIKNINKVGLTIDTLLQDINSKTKKSRISYVVSDLERYPFLAHKIAIGTNKEIGAPSIEWMDKFIIFSKYVSSKKSQIIVADYTLSYQKVIVSGGLNIFPKWANSNQSSFYYTSYDGLYPTLVKQNLYGKGSEKIISSDGMVVCSDVNKDGSKLLLTMSPNGHTDIYLYDLNEKKSTRLTNYSGIDVSGSFLSPESSIVFVSDRIGKPNIFLLNTVNNNTERLVFQGTSNSQAVAFNNYIVFSGRDSGHESNLYLISTKNDLVRQLTHEGSNHFPKFSPDGESVLFVKNYNSNSYVGILRLNYNKTFFFPMKVGKLQSIDW